MIRNAIVIFIELLYLVLQHPEELPVYVRKIPNLKAYIGVSLALSSLSMATGVYALRDYYQTSFWIFVLILTVNHAALSFLWALCLGAVLDAVVRIKHPDRTAKVWHMISIVLLSTLPFIFFLSGALPARLLPHPVLIMVPVTLGLLIWSLYITLRGLQYLYELSFREGIKIFLQSAFAVLIFPVVWLIFMIVEFTGIFN